MKRIFFRNKILPYLLIAPQMVVTIIFFLWPAGEAVLQSFQREDAFGLHTTWVGLANYRALFQDPDYIHSLQVTVVFTIGVTAVALIVALLLALAVDRTIKAGPAYTTLLVWPYAVAPAVVGVLWWFLFNPTIGLMPYLLSLVGYHWNHALKGDDAMILVIISAAWPQVSYNFLFFVAGLQSIPGSMREAAAIDGAGPVKRFFTITLPLLSPTTFFLVVVNFVYAMFATFPVIDATTQGGPAGATNILVFKVYQDGFVGLNLGSSAAQSVVLLAIVIALTVIQFRFIERRVEY
ncbi:glycerol-3-phosphate transporter permease [Defluviimonas sp. 20V17]|uniref:sn-glycerol-3-phosphate transport system permease protein UgpA n=1 Tax=Allgaiera indica TaxID=765699 RepID=A0AAN4UNR4_9RHOB|nr:sn-glycerol-3-phosphate ABC transporter permease UgpA [Allgaiera indica]KDB03996.1 glycerol-3-phosphate transporter permease [Defluviimonas sp. 20V17]GHD99366.1 glycerol-3-phosphate transporter permease [Allgaiera indica]SDW27983.1 carbohydrate ABC transporter membrane protein 1, CUT1 family [Allgaiera indica]